MDRNVIREFVCLSNSHVPSHRFAVESEERVQVRAEGLAHAIEGVVDVRGELGAVPHPVGQGPFRVDAGEVGDAVDPTGPRGHEVDHFHPEFIHGEIDQDRGIAGA